MKNENLSKKFLTTITCPECGGRMIVEATRGNREDTFQACTIYILAPIYQKEWMGKRM